MIHEAATSPVLPEQGGDTGEELAYRLHQQRLTAEYGLLALKTHKLSALLQEATRVCAKGLRSELCKILEYLPSENEFIVRAGVGWKPGVVGRARVGADLESPTGYAFHTEQPVISNHLEGESRFRTPELLAEHGVKRAINVLIQGDDYRFGVLEVDSPTEGRFTEADLAFLQGFANLLGVAIERQRTEDELRQSEALKNAILEAALDCIVSIRDDGRIMEWNPAAERTFGYTREVALGCDVAELIIPLELRDRHRRGMAHYLATGEGPVLGKRVELEAIRADGSRFPVELAISPIEIGGRPHFTAYLRDITARTRAEQASRESEQRLRATYEHAFVGIAEVDANGRFLRVNDECSEITGYSREELLARSFADITHPDDRGSDLEQFRRQMAGDIDTYALEKRYLHKDGHTVWIELAASRVDDAQGQPLYGVRVVRDVTERKRAERHKQLLINELNHRVKNTLATVQSIAAQTLRSAASPEQARKDLETRLTALARTHDVLTRENWEGAELRDIVEQAIEPYRNGEQDRVHLRGPEVRLSPRIALALAMALQELVTNAVKYGALSNAAGEVRITWTVSPASSAERLHLRWEEIGGPPVQKPSRRGFGSLLIERGLAKQLDGEVSIDFAPDGLTCTVDIPLAQTMSLLSQAQAGQAAP